jgi:transcriptional regulator with XRE-family HTH domain
MEQKNIDLIMNELKRMVKVNRMLKNMTFQELSKKTGLSISFLTTFERMDNKSPKTVSFDTLLQLLDALDLIEDFNICLRAAFAK